MNIAICEDDPADMDEIAKRVRRYAVTHGLEAELHCFSSGEELTMRFQKGLYQIVVMDILLGGQSGLDVSRHIAALDSECLLVFLTSSPHYALEGYEVSAVHYLLKPVTEEKITHALDRCMQKLTRYMRAITVRSGRADVRVLLKNIEFLEVFNKKTTIHIIDGEIDTYTALDKLEAALGGLPFLRCHRCAVVNLHYVAEMTPDNFLMRSGASVPIRQSGSGAVRQQYFDFLFARSRNEI